MKKLMFFVAAAVILVLMMVPPGYAGQQATIEIDKAILQNQESVTIPLTVLVDGQEISIELKLTVAEPNDSEPGGNAYIPPVHSQSSIMNYMKRMKMLGRQGLNLHNWDDYKWLDSGMLPPL